jgi:hypothetical protein
VYGVLPGMIGTDSRSSDKIELAVLDSQLFSFRTVVVYKQQTTSPLSSPLSCSSTALLSAKIIK